MRKNLKKQAEPKDGIKSGIGRVKRYLKRLIFLEGLEVVLLSFAFSTVAGFLLDMIFKLSYAGRYAVLCSGLFIIGLSGLFFLVIPLFKRMDDEELALRLEEANPGLKSSLISSVQLKRARFSEELAVSSQMIEALRAETFSHLKSVKYKKIYGKIRLAVLAFFIAGASLGMIKYASSYPAAVRTFLDRVLRPGADIAPFSFTKVELLPKDCFILKGGKVDIRVTLTGVIKDKAFLHYRPRSTPEWQTLALDRQKPGEFTFAFNGITDSLEYYATGGDGTSNVYGILVRERPALIRTAFTYVYPEYTGLPSKTDDVSSGGLAAVYGTKIRAEFAANTGIKKAELVFKNGSRKALNVAGGNNMTAGLEVLEDTAFSINMQSREGFSNTESPEFSVSVLPDNPPLLSVLEPEKNISVTKIAVLGLSVKAADDFGVKKLELKYTVVKRGKEVTVPIPAKDIGGRQVGAFFSWDLGPLRLSQGQKIEYTVLAYDNNPYKQAVTQSDIYTVNIIGKTEMLANIREKEKKSSEEIGKLIARENEEKSKADKLKDKQAFNDDEKNEMTKSAQAQDAISEQALKISDDLKELTEERKSNQVASLSELKSREALQSSLEEVAKSEMPDAANLTRAGALSEDAGKAAKSMASASQKQQDILQKLGQLQNSLGMFDSLEQLIAEAQRLLGEQTRVNGTMKKVKKPADADFGQLAGAETVIADGVKNLRAQTESVNGLLKGTSPEISASLEQITAEYTPIQDSLRSIQSDIQAANTVYLILNNQEILIGQMRKLAADLEALRKQKGGLAAKDAQVDPEEKKLEDLTNALDAAKQMAEQQTVLNNQTRQLVRNQSKTQLEARELAQQQAQLKSEAADLGAELAKDPGTEKLGADMKDIAGKMDQASAQLNTKDTGKGVQKMQQDISGKLNKLQSNLQGELGKEQSKAGMAGMAGGGQGHEAEAVSFGKQQKVNKLSASWGDLPPEVQKEMLGSAGENVPPEYAEFLRAYYRKLAEKGNR